MDYAQSFEEFSRGLSHTDLALYAGIGVVLWVLFKDKLSPVQKLVLDFLNKLKVPKQLLSTVKTSTSLPKEDVFFQLVTSWKQTRDLAVQSGCEQAVKVADEMFPHLSPQNCGGVQS